MFPYKKSPDLSLLQTMNIKSINNKQNDKNWNEYLSFDEIVNLYNPHQTIIQSPNYSGK